ncbi:MAG: S8 family serine peptidase, partial [Akkermansiaceae bacterium]|nr:S8 family serine peptidase [Akkermansiaceae bacterium]
MVLSLGGLLPNVGAAGDSDFDAREVFKNQNAEVIELRESPLPARAMARMRAGAGKKLVRRHAVAKVGGRYPHIRAEEIVERDLSGTAPDAVRQRRLMVADHVIVRIGKGANDKRLRAIARRFNGAIRKKLLGDGLYLVACPAHGVDDVPNALSALRAAGPDIEHATPDYIVRTHETFPDDPDLALLYGLHNTGQNGGAVDADIDAPEAWDLTTGGGIVVGVIDTGVEYTHEDLAANMWINPGEIPGDGIDNDGNGFVDDIHGWDFLNEDNDPMDDNSHGTHCAGTIAGVGNNGIGVVGVNWNAKIMALKFLGAGGSGPISAGIECQNYANMMRRDYGVNIRLTSNSWGGGGFSQDMHDSIEAAKAEDILFIAAAGNDFTDNDITPHYPSSYANDNIIAVAATDRDDSKASFSNWGLTSVDIGAPGVSIRSTVLDDGYGSKSGTSMATPHVAGAAALVLSLGPFENYSSVKTAIMLGGDAVASMQGTTVSGNRLNVFGAIGRLGMQVRGSDPANNSIVTSPPLDFVASFTSDFDPASVDTSDILVNGLAPDIATTTDGNTVTYSFHASPVAVEGPQSLSVLANSVTRLSDGEGVGAFTADFRYDIVRLAVVSTTPADGSTATIPVTAFQVDFNEPLDASTVDIGDLSLAQGTVTGFNLVDADTVEYFVSGITDEGILACSLGAGNITDVFGNPCLGHSWNINVDATTQVGPESFLGISPLGSLIYKGSDRGFIAPAADTDEFTFDLDGNQTIAIRVNPESTLQASIVLRDPADTLIGSATSASAGGAAIVQPVSAAQPGTYKVTIGELGGTTGGYEFTVLLNAFLEEEDEGGAQNNVRGQAENIDASFLDLGAGGADRAAVLGTIASTSNVLLAAEGFEGGALGPQWSIWSSDASGRIRVTGEHGAAEGSMALLMDRSPAGDMTGNDATWTIDASGLNQLTLEFMHASWFDQTQISPGRHFSGHLSVDG